MSVTEIARRAGVSIATVSRVLNGHPRVRPETAAQVQKVLDDLRYVRPLIRRGPRLGRRARSDFSSIAVLSGCYPSETCFRVQVFAATLSGIVQAGRSMQINVMVDHVPNPMEISPSLRNGEIDGALVLLPASAPSGMQVLEALRRHLPIVRIMGESLTSSTVDHVTPDNAAVGHLACEYLVAQGCRELAFVTTTPEWDVNRMRAFGFTNAASRVGINACCYLVTDKPLETEGYGARVVRCVNDAELADRLSRPSLVHGGGRATGIFTCRDADATRLYPLLKARDFMPGRDVTFCSCDNDEMQLSLLEPRPVSIDLDPEEIGRRALLRLGGRIRKPDEPPCRMLVAPRMRAIARLDAVAELALA